MTGSSSISLSNELYTAVIVDDEEQSILNLSALISRYCPQITVIGKANSVTSGREVIESMQPDILFLDVKLRGENGFALLDSLHTHSFALIFVTAYDHYALQAIKASAVDYLLKPVSIRELQEGVEKGIQMCRSVREPRYARMYTEILRSLATSLHNRESPHHLLLPTSDGLFVQETQKIVRLEADGSYTILVREGEREIVLSKPLKVFEQMLDRQQFARIHHSHIINLRYLQKYIRNDGGYVVMADRSHIPVSRRRTTQFLEWLETRMHLM
ncbi:MAG: LytR/AlgR family response regulator transcription factor [Candidatus Kapaibacterium sp.]